MCNSLFCAFVVLVLVGRHLLIPARVSDIVFSLVNSLYTDVGCCSRLVDRTTCCLQKVDHAHEIYKRMADNGVVVRFRGNELHCNDCLRITVGTPEENKALLALLKETVAAVAASASS